jgi:Pin2-interacting protein X1
LSVGKEQHDDREMLRLLSSVISLLSFQEKATTGKQGLGIRDRPKKVAGCHFKGKKTSFSDSEDEDSSDLGYLGKRKRDDSSEQQRTDEPKVKLKKLCKKLLRQVSSPKL